MDDCQFGMIVSDALWILGSETVSEISEIPLQWNTHALKLASLGQRMYLATCHHYRYPKSVQILKIELFGLGSFVEGLDLVICNSRKNMVIGLFEINHYI